MIYLKLRSNIKIKDDLELAKRELESLFDDVSAISSPKYFEKSGIPTVNTRSEKPVGFTCDKPKTSLFTVLRFLNFTQEVWIKKNDPFLIDNLNQGKGYKNGKYIMFVPLMASSEIVEKTYNGKFSEKNYENLNHFLVGEKIEYESRYVSAVNYQTSSTQHVHGLHKYKAKFFPRFVRSLIVSHIQDVPHNSKQQKTILDPFVGSGTTLVESSMLGFQSYGLDIDTLSCEISKAKIRILEFSHEESNKYIQYVEKLLPKAPTSLRNKIDKNYKFPNLISAKYKRWHALDEQVLHERQISSILQFVGNIKDNKLKTLLSICLSDALCKKFNIRMMGTGSGRFSLEIAKTELFSLFITNLKNLMKILYSTASLKRRFDIKPAQSKISNENAKSMPFKDDVFSLIVTSPPYLPASSGRENYLVGKAIPLTALGLANDSELEKIDSNSVGSINALMSHDDGKLPSSVYHLVDWLSNDPLRNIKAKPILNYYIDLKKALSESKRVLVKKGIAVYIIGKSSTFYNNKTKDIVYKVKCDDIFQEIAESVGLKVIEKTDIELDKKNKNARPRSLDSYYETAFALKK